MTIKRSGIFYFRRAIPKDLINHLNCQEIKVSLRTRNRTKALQRELLYDIQFNQIITQARRGVEFPNGFISRFETITKTETQRDGSQITETVKTIGPEIIQAFKDAGLSASEITKLTEIFLTAKDESHSQVVSPNSPENAQKITLGEYVEKFKNDYEIINKSSLDPRVLTRLRRLMEISDSNMLLSEFKLEHAGHLRDVIIKLPAKNRKYSKLSAIQAIKAAERDNPSYARLTAKTINDYLETYRALFKKAIADNLYPERINPFQDIRVAKRGSEARAEIKRRANSKHQPFSSYDLKSIFSTDLYSAFGSDIQHENFKFWMPLLGLFTGSRMSQLASLYCDDIRSEKGINIIDFNENTDDKIVKTSASIRIVPVHPVLEKLGLIEFSNKVKQSGHKRLFPELNSFSRGTYAKRFEEWFNRRLLLDVGIRNQNLDRGKSFHSFRATLLDLLKQAGIEESQRNQIIGWTHNSKDSNKIVRQHYDSVNLSVMKDALKKISLPNVLNDLPPFPHKKELNFLRPRINQYNKQASRVVVKK
jgi:hypothetical protein